MFPTSQPPFPVSRAMSYYPDHHSPIINPYMYSGSPQYPNLPAAGALHAQSVAAHRAEEG